MFSKQGDEQYRAAPGYPFLVLSVTVGSLTYHSLVFVLGLDD